MSGRVDLPTLYPIGTGEPPAAWTDRLLSRAREHRTNRQCSLGWHDECSQRDLGADAECNCICHDPDAAIYTAEGHAEGGTVTVTRTERGQHRWPPVDGEPATAWARWVWATSLEEARTKAKAAQESAQGIIIIIEGEPS